MIEAVNFASVFRAVWGTDEDESAGVELLFVELELSPSPMLLGRDCGDERVDEVVRLCSYF
jgi:hypothetical protein